MGIHKTFWPISNNPTFHSFSVWHGVSAPYDEILWFRPKYPKPCWPWHGPSGALRGSPTPAAGKLAALKHCPPFSPVSVALLGHATRPGESRRGGPTNPPELNQGPPMSSERPLRWSDSRHRSLCKNRLDTISFEWFHFFSQRLQVVRRLAGLTNSSKRDATARSITDSLSNSRSASFTSSEELGEAKLVLFSSNTAIMPIQREL